MSARDFSDSIKLAVIKKSLEKNNGNILCEICGKKVSSISECHFDHIYPYAKGGTSTLSNCQILCNDCNLKKNDKYMEDYLLDKQAKDFLLGKNISNNNVDKEIILTDENDNFEIKDNDMTKENFDKCVKAFIDRKGDIHKVDFTREYNHLPSIHYVRVFYGDLNTLKKSFGIIDKSLNWNREAIISALSEYIEENGNIFQKDLIKENGLPSLPCILSYYPEYKTFTDVKTKLLNLEGVKNWNKDNIIEASKEFLKNHDSITQKDLKAVNNLPTIKVITRIFGNMSNYQKEIGSKVFFKNEFISKDDIKKELESYFNNKERIIESQESFFKKFKYSPSTIFKRYGGFEKFANEEKITVVKTKKARYSKREVDDAISEWIKEGKEIPNSKELSKLGLPSMSVIMKYYENWKEPFFLYQKMFDEINRRK